MTRRSVIWVAPIAIAAAFALTAPRPLEAASLTALSRVSATSSAANRVAFLLGNPNAENYTIGDLDGNGEMDIRYAGTGANETLELKIESSNVIRIRLDRNGDGDFLDTGEGELVAVGFLNWNISMGGGNDRVQYIVPGDASDTKIQFAVDLGPGSDVLSMSDPASAVLTGSRITIDGQGGTGDDEVDLVAPELDQSSLTARFDLGAGNDAAAVVAKRLDGSTLTVGMELGAGANSAAVTMSSFIVNRSRVHVSVNGGKNDDDVKVVVLQNVESDSIVRGRANLGAGDDRFRGEFDVAIFDLRDLDGGNSTVMDFEVDGGAGDDALEISRVVNGSPTSGMVILEGNFFVRFRGGDGDDVLDFDWSAFVLSSAIGPAVQHECLVHFDGGRGDDVLTFIGGDDAGGAPYDGQLDVQLRGGLDNDTLELLGNFTGATFGKAGFMLVDGGGGGADAGVAYGRGPARVRNCEKP